jgi:tRNA(Ile)-lysidine synthase
MAKLERGQVTVRVRRGGERLQPAAGRPRRSLKNLLQEANIPPWQRARLPLLFHDNVLVWVPWIGIDCRYRAQPGAAALLPRWRDSSLR